jgi:hypothetical protein
MASDEVIATSSIEEGLDFASSLISSAIPAAGEASREQANRLLADLCSYVQLRYVGEPLLALEYLVSLGRACDPKDFRSQQFWRQLNWIAEQMSLTNEQWQSLGLPEGCDGASGA